MNSLPAGSVDLIFADPPYNLQLKGELHRPDNSKVDAVDDHWDQFSSFAAYDRFTRDWLAAARRLLKPNGAIWVIGSYHNIFRVGAELQNQGFWILNDVVWRKSNPMPNFRGKRLTNAHETLIWAAAEAAKYTFNYEALKALNEGVQMRSDWVLPICTGGAAEGRGGDKAHPTQKPEALLHRMLVGDQTPATWCWTRSSAPAPPARWPRCWAATSSASSARKAYREGRRRRGSPACASSMPRHWRSPAEARRAARALRPGGRTRHAAPGRRAVSHRQPPQGQGARRWHLIGNDVKGSIHQVGAALEGAPSCNGWTYWHFKREGKMVPIDILRQQIRAEMEAESG
jgi:modification methylase